MSGFISTSTNGGEQLLVGGVTVATIAALSTVPISEDLAWVESLQCYWKRNSTSILVPDGITIISSSGGGNWERIVSSTSFKWLGKNGWVIDPILGNDEGDGYAVPLATFSKLNRRLSVGSIQQDTTIIIPKGADIDNAELTVDIGKLYSVSTVDWHIPGTARPIIFCQLNSLNAPI